MKHRYRPCAVLFALALLAGCSPAVPSPGGSDGPPAGASGGPAASGIAMAQAVPHGASRSVDAASWALVDRLAAPAYTADTTAALVEGLARAGIGTYDDPSSGEPTAAVTVPASPFRLLAFQVHALAVGAWAGSDFSGAELDAVVPLPPGLAGVPTTSQLLAAYVATADSPGGNLARALMAGQDLLVPAELQFPGVVLVLFVSDLATDGGRLAAPAPSPRPAAQIGLPLAGLAAGPDLVRTVAEPMAVATGICSQTTSWISGAIASLFNALKVATPPSGVRRIIAGIWNWLVDVGQAFVRGLIDSVTDLVLGTIRSIAETVAAVAEQIGSLLPQAVAVRAAGDGGGATFRLGPDPLPGSFMASVTSGDLPDWPAVMTDCAKVAKVALPDFHDRSVPLTWGPLEAPPNPLLGPTGSNPATDADGQASWGFMTSVEPGDPTGEQRNQVDYMPVAVHRPELDAARQRLGAVLLGSIPELLRPYVAAIFAPYLNGIQARLNALLDAHGRGAAVIIFHAEGSPAPSQPASPAASGACSPNPVAAGTYTGTITNKTLETIDISSSDASTTGRTVATSDGSGPATVVVAADGSVSGSWTQRIHFVFDEMAGSSGTVIKEHRDEVMDYTGGTVIGSACQLALGNATLRIVSCTSSLSGDCSADRVPSGPGSGLGITMGAPSSISPGSVTWTWQYTETGGQPSISATLTLTVSGPRPGS